MTPAAQDVGGVDADCNGREGIALVTLARRSGGEILSRAPIAAPAKDAL
jgi:hypothetical protein